MFLVGHMTAVAVAVGGEVETTTEEVAVLGKVLLAAAAEDEEAAVGVTGATMPMPEMKGVVAAGAEAGVAHEKAPSVAAKAGVAQGPMPS